MQAETALDRQALLQWATTLAPSFLVSLGATEAFFHFHSFSLELLAFGAVWSGLFGLQSLVLGAFRK